MAALSKGLKKTEKQEAGGMNRAIQPQNYFVARNSEVAQVRMGPLNPV